MNLSKGFISHLIPIAIFFVLVSIFFAPLYSGKTLVQSDNVQLSGSMKEVADYREKGEMIGWTNREFAGLPILSGSEYNPFIYINRLFFGGFIPKMIMMVFALFFGFYLLSQVVGAGKWVSAIGAFAFAFSTFNMISIEAGHDNKVLAMAFMAPVIAGVILVYKGKYLVGGLITVFAAGLQLLYGHIQITYYLLIIVLAYLILVLVKTIKAGTWNEFIRGSITLLIATLIAILGNFGKLYSTLEYSSYSTRGGSELSSTDQPRDGLDKEYAMAWSSGVLETLTTVFPYFHGGATGEQLSDDSETYKALKSKGVDQQTTNNVTASIPLYWGDQPFTAGPIYFGITVMFFFIMGLYLIKGSMKWWIVGLTILSFALAMGKNLAFFNDFFFNYIPLYNKFRSVTMSFSIGQLLVPLLGVMALNEIVKRDVSAVVSRKALMQSVAIVGGLGIIFLFFKGAFFDFKGINDTQYFAQFPDWLIRAIVEDRKSKFNGDVIRSLIFICFLGAGTWFFIKEKLSARYYLIGLSVLVFIDLWAVNKRYISLDDFDKSRQLNRQVFQPSNADNQILQDDSYYRVFNTTRRLDQDGLTSYHHFSVGGYNAIKMQRYQEVIERYISQGNRNVLNMLNVKYYIVQNDQQLIAQRNAGALGNAWPVQSLMVVDNADEEISALGDFDPVNTAIVDNRFNDYLESISKSYTGEASVEFLDYHPEELRYKFSSDTDQFLAFSEIYYKPGWNAYIDDQKVEHIRVNYLLRGMHVPSGEHTVVFKYEPVSETIGDILAIASIFLILVSLGVYGFVVFRVKE